MNLSNIDFILNVQDHGGRRSGNERRKFNYTDHIPERRVNGDRRISKDRRSGYDRRDFLSLNMDYDEQRSHIDRRAAWQ